MASDWVLGHGLDFPGTVSCALAAPVRRKLVQ